METSTSLLRTHAQPGRHERAQDFREADPQLEGKVVRAEAKFELVAAGGRTPGASVAEIAELQGQVEVLRLQQLDHRL